MPQSDELVGRLRVHVAEEMKALQEEIEMGQGQATTAILSELQLDLRLLTACCEHDRCQLGLDMTASMFWNCRLQDAEKEVAQVMSQWQETSNTPFLPPSAVESGADGEDPKEATHEDEVWDLRQVLDPGESAMAMEKHPEFGKDTEEMIEKGVQPATGVLLQTRTVPQMEVWENLEAWRQPLTDEVVALKTNHQAVASIQPEDVAHSRQGSVYAEADHQQTSGKDCGVWKFLVGSR